MLVTVSGPVPVLCRVMVLAVLVLPTACEEKDSVAGDTAAAGVVPVPFNATTWVGPRFPESSLTVSAPATEPTADGVNVMEKAQVDPGARTVGQVLVAANPPLAESPNPFRGLPPKFATVIVWAALVVPTF
jgi:hypothetical protein